MDGDRLLVEHFPRLRGAARRIAARYPAWHRDDIASELLVAMVVAARRWDGRSPFLFHVEQQMRYAASDYMRYRPEWNRGDRTQVEPVAVEWDGWWILARDGDPEVWLETVELLRAVAETVPPRERVALLAPTLRDGASALGVTESRASQLRARALERLALRGVGPLAEAA